MSLVFTSDGEPRVGRIITIVGTLVVIIILALASVRIVEPGHRGVVITFGKVESNILGEGGPYIITPFIQDVIQVSVQIQKEDAEASAASHDLQDVTTHVTLNYHLDASKANIIYQTLRLDFTDRVIKPSIQEAVKASTAQFTAEDLIQRREAVKALIEQTLAESLIKNNIIVDRVSITEFRFSEVFSRAIESKQEAEQLALKASNDLRRIEIEAQQTIVRASASANATLLQAQAQAEALRLQRQEVSELLNQFKAIEKWDGKLPQFVGQTPLPFIDVNKIVDGDGSN